MLVHLKVEHHVHAIAVRTEILHVGPRKDIGLSQDDTITPPPLKKFAEPPGFRMDAVPFVIAKKGAKVKKPIEQYDMWRAA
jgi:hypothetical protein